MWWYGSMPINSISHPLPDALAMLMTDGDVPFRVPGPTATFGLRFGQLDRKGRGHFELTLRYSVGKQHDDNENADPFVQHDASAPTSSRSRRSHWRWRSRRSPWLCCRRELSAPDRARPLR